DRDLEVVCHAGTLMAIADSFGPRQHEVESAFDGRAGLVGVVQDVEGVLAVRYVHDPQACRARTCRLDERLHAGGDVRTFTAHPGQHDRQFARARHRLGRPETRLDVED